MFEILPLPALQTPESGTKLFLAVHFPSLFLLSVTSVATNLIYFRFPPLFTHTAVVL